MSRNGRQHPPRPRIELHQSAATPEEAAAIAAAIEQFLRDTTPAQDDAGAPINPWRRAGLLESAGLDALPDRPWGGAAHWSPR